jgi:hypothetical protein
VAWDKRRLQATEKYGSNKQEGKNEKQVIREYWKKIFRGNIAAI